MLRAITAACLALLVTAGCAAAPATDPCAAACDKIAECKVSPTIPFVCGETSPKSCADSKSWSNCAACLNDKECLEVKAGGCNNACQL